MMVRMFARTALAAAALLGGSHCLMADEEAEMLTIGSKAPELNVEHWVSDGHGKFKPVTKFENGKVYVVEFWATWCGPCVASMPHLAETQEKYAEKGVQIVSISDEDLETVQGFLKREVQSREEEPADGAEKSEDKTKTYGDLTSVYCLTTDPDRSVAEAYMEAAGQNGIPTCFIVGKSGLVEWIGHPMAMDDPLSAVVGDSWDREKFLADFKKQQDRNALMGKISGLMRKKDSEGALKLVEDAKKEAEGDDQYLAMLNQLEVQIRISPAIEKVQAGEVEEGMKELDAVAKTATPEMQQRLRGLQLRILISLQKYDEAATFLETVTGDKKVTAELLNEMSWQLYEAAKESGDFPKPLIAAATAAAEKAVELDGKNSMILDTLSHLLHMNGDLDRAIEVQEQAVKNANAPQEQLNEQMAEYLKELKAEKAGK